MFSPAAGPFQQRHPKASASQTPFQRLKPVCVELLSLTGRSTAPAQSQQVLACLRRLKTALRTILSDDSASYSDLAEPLASSSKLVAADWEPSLPASLVNYVFYPLSELISTAPRGITSLADSVAEAVLEVLALLCSQWWMAWSAQAADGSSQSGNNGWQVWCDLVILSSSILGSPVSRDADQPGNTLNASDEVKLAALRVLGELLVPRFKALPWASSTGGVAGKASEAEWEWDGVSDLPLLDDEEEVTKTSHGQGLTTKDEAPPEGIVTLAYPTPAHLTYAATDRVTKGAISFVLSSCFAIAESSQESVETRSAAISVASHALLLWIGGTCPYPPAATQQHAAKAVKFEIPALHYVELSTVSYPSSGSSEGTAQLAVAHRLRPLLPGLTSSLTRLATSRVKAKQGSKPKPTPRSVAARAIDLLGGLFRATLSDECLGDVLSQKVPLTPSRTTRAKLSIKVTNLEDFADADIDRDSGSAGIDAPDEDESVDDISSEPAASKDAQWALSTLAQVHLALKTFSSLTQSSLPGTSLPSSVDASVQKAILRLAAALLSECVCSFDWLDRQLESMAALNIKDTDSDSSHSSSITTLLCCIVDLASEFNSETVAQNARAAFGAVRKRAVERKQAGEDAEVLAQLSSGAVLWSVLMQALSGLPVTIAAHNDEGTSRLALRVGTVLELLQQKHAAAMAGGSALVGLANLSRDMQHTCVQLLRPLKIERLDYVEESDPLAASTTWRLQPIFSGLEASTSTQLGLMFFQIGRSLALSLIQELKLSHSKSATKPDASQVFALITFLVDRAASLRSVRLASDANQQGTLSRSESLTSLVVAADLLRGVCSCLDNLEVGLQFADLGGARGLQAGKLARKAAHKLSKRVFAAVMDMLDGDAEEATRSEISSGRLGRQDSTEQVDTASTAEGAVSSLDSPDHTLVEHVKGISLASDDIDSSTPDRHGPALDLGFVRAADLSRAPRGGPSNTATLLAIQHRYQQAERHIDLSNALLFALLSSSSKLLGQSFRTLLLRGSYPLISGMSASSTASSELVRQASTSAMRDIAFYTAYADVKNCLLDHADYILGSACQRLISGLDEELRTIALADLPTAPSSPSTTLSRGAVREKVVLPLVSAQRAPFVLVEMIRVLGSEIIPMVEDAIDEILDALDRFHHHATICDGLLAVLDSVLETMAVEQASRPVGRGSNTLDQVAAVAHERSRDELDMFKAWLAARRHEQPAFDNAAHDGEGTVDPEEKDDKPTKSQQVATQILSKAAVFLTHPSPNLRFRVLGLLRHGIQTLAPQARTAELLPVINSAWPFVMTRLGTAYSNAKGSRSSQLVPIIDLAPAAVGTRSRERDEAWYRKAEAGLAERDPQVWVAAARFVEAAVEHVPEFVGKRVVEEAWPRFEMLLTLMRWKFDPRMTRWDNGAQRAPVAGTVESKVLLDSESTSTDGAIHKLVASDPHRTAHLKRPTPTSHAHMDPPFILPSASSVPGQLTLCILITLAAVVRFLAARMPDDAAWNITTHPSLLGLLDARQPPAVLKAAEELYIELGRRNPEATAWALQAALPAAATGGEAATPYFMNHGRFKVHAETVHHVLSCLT
ncbi:hypothetical protein EX895_001657 [Sporisorium graminicola]|uniref:TTI1 C-terminal TPR domain-containing protein n=1 Tax=Sporisorium graminicola TaxID=280036 RepID=A0A4U7KXS6_9BASI|nr:hypothetical protein EX895_001657 [Sporisorium graminicola]TKY89126.1 hypothetical protein EX895_001657 [Sporisorium graminicola]